MGTHSLVQSRSTDGDDHRHHDADHGDDHGDHADDNHDDHDDLDDDHDHVHFSPLSQVPSFSE